MGSIKAGAVQHKDVITLFENIVNALLNRSLDDAGLDIGATPAEVETNNAIDILIDGQFFNAAAAASIALSGTAQQIGEFCKYLVSVNSAGTYAVTQGKIAASSDLAVLPELPENQAPVGYVEVEAASAVFTPGTTALNAAGITDTYADISVMSTGKSKLSLNNLNED